MKVKQLLPSQKITNGDYPTSDLVEIIQRMAVEINALSDKMAAIAAVVEPTGGSTSDTTAREAIRHIIEAAAS